MSEEVVGRCWHCGRGLGRTDYGRETACLGCGKSTHVCRNCRFYAPARPNECQEPLVERVMDKTRANFCDFFMPAREPLQGPRPGPSDELRKAAEALFRK
jgi:hypothetical protein